MWTVQESRNRPPKSGAKVFYLVGKFARGRERPPRKKEFPPKCAVLDLTQGDRKKLTSTATQTVERVADAVDISSRGMLDLSEWEVVPSAIP